MFYFILFEVVGWSWFLSVWGVLFIILIWISENELFPGRIRLLLLPVPWLKPPTHDHVFLDNFSLTIFLWQGALLKSWSCQLLSKATCQGKLANFFGTHEQIKFVKEKCTKENLAVCMGLNTRRFYSSRGGSRSPNVRKNHSCLLIFARQTSRQRSSFNVDTGGEGQIQLPQECYSKYIKMFWGRCRQTDSLIGFNHFVRFDQFFNMSFTLFGNDNIRFSKESVVTWP